LVGLEGLDTCNGGHAGVDQLGVVRLNFLWGVR